MNGDSQEQQEQLDNLRQQLADQERRRSICEELSRSPVPDEAAAGERCLDDVGRRINYLLRQLRFRERQGVKIDGIEQTQAIQFFRPPLEPCPDRPGSVRCPENDIQLIAGKTTVLRAYVDVAPGTPTVTTLSGVLETRQSESGSWNPTLTPINAPITAQRAANIDRGTADHTLNFRILAAWCYGTLETRLTVFDAAHPQEAGFTSVPVTRTISFVDVSPLKIRLVRIRYRNDARGFDLDPPTTEDFWTTAEYVLKTFPIPDILIVRDSEELYDGNFKSFFNSGGPEAQGTTGVIFQILNDLIAAENLPSDVLYLALIPGPPANQTAPGWAAGGKSITETNGPVMAQEVGHNRGFPGHAPCPPSGAPGSPADIDPNYPDYDQFLPASIGEFGFDIVNSNVYDPAIYRDFMSYCGPTWVSPYTYEKLMKRFMLSTTAIQPVEIVHRQSELLYLSFTISHDGVVVPEETSFHLKGFRIPQVGISTPYFVELHDKEGRILEVQRLHIDDVHRSLDDAYQDFFLALPWRAEADKVVFKREEKILHLIEIGKAVPEVEIKSPKGGGTLTGKQKVDWIASCDQKPLSYILRYSNDGGQSWHSLATRLTVSEFTVDLNALPGGQKCIFQVLASDEGIRTGVATSESFSVPPKPFKPSIISPQNGDTFALGESVHLFGVASSPDGSAESLNWSSKIDGHLGTGSQVIVHTLSAGRHCVTLSADDGCNGEASKSIYITVRPRESQTAGQIVVATREGRLTNRCS